MVLLQCRLDRDTSLSTAPSRASHGPEKSHLLSLIQLDSLRPVSFNVTTRAQSYLFSSFALALSPTRVLTPPLSVAPLLPQFLGLKGQFLPEASPDPPSSGLPQPAPIVTSGTLSSNVRTRTPMGVKGALVHIMHRQQANPGCMVTLIMAFITPSNCLLTGHVTPHPGQQTARSLMTQKAQFSISCCHSRCSIHIC